MASSESSFFPYSGYYHLNRQPVLTVELPACVLHVRTPSGRQAWVTVTVMPNQVDFVVRLDQPQAVLMRLAPASPGFGLADHAVSGRAEFNTDITGYSNERFLNGSSFTRIGSNFANYPKHNFVFLVWDPATRIVPSTATECLQASRRVEIEGRFRIFTGTPREIYRQFLESRNQYGHPVLKPKYELLGVGWEALGALAWDTNTKTVAENVDRYLAEDYPLAWTLQSVAISPPNGNAIRLTMRDHSLGVPEKSLPHLFEPFFRVFPGAGKNADGSGLA